jgi:putative nucleotidyltransferase with HDIG domain
MPESKITSEGYLEETLTGEAESLTAAESRAEAIVGLGFVAAVAGLIALAGGIGAVEPLNAALSVALLACAHRARFYIVHAWTAPVQVAFVPALFMLPPEVVPIAVAAGIALGRVPDVLRGDAAPSRLLLSMGNSWFSIGPALLLILAGSPTPGEAGVLLLVALFAAQLASDFGSSLLWYRVARGASVREQLVEARWVYAVDAALAPIGLLAALAIDESPWYAALALPLFVLLDVFARERQARLEQLLELSHAYRGTAMVLGDVVGADDAYTGEHSRSVLELSLAVTDELGLDARQRRNVEFGALLHDVGKVAIPNEVINKPGALTDEEWALMRTHTAEGQRILDRVGGFMREVGVIVRASHERWDGGGYPDGLAGDAIPLEARIIAACDAYDAMTSTRSYRAAVSAAEARAELDRCAGSQFDPRVVAALLAVIGDAAAAPVVAPVAA